jgi:hypothetical protein
VNIVIELVPEPFEEPFAEHPESASVAAAAAATIATPNLRRVLRGDILVLSLTGRNAVQNRSPPPKRRRASLRTGLS